MKLKYWAIIILATAAVCAGVFYYLNQPAPDLGPVVVHHALKSESPPTPQPSASSSSADISAISFPSAVEGWKTYTNSQYGFFVSYPDNLEVTEGKKDNSVSFSDPKYNDLPSILTISVEQSTKQYLGTQQQMLLALAKDQLGGNFSSLRRYQGNEIIVDSLDIYGVHSYIYDSSLNLFASIIGRDSADDNNDLYNKILSTFQFTQPQAGASVTTSPSAVVGWKTYVSSDYGVEFDYPADWTIGIDSYDQSISINEPGDDLGDGSIGISKNLYTKEAVLAQINQDPEVQIIGQTTEVYNNLNWSKVTTKEKASGHIGIDYFNKKNNDTVTIAYFYYPTQEMVVKKVLNSFKFTK